MNLASGITAANRSGVSRLNMYDGVASPVIYNATKPRGARVHDIRRLTCLLFTTSQLSYLTRTIIFKRAQIRIQCHAYVLLPRLDVIKRVQFFTLGRRKVGVEQQMTKQRGRATLLSTNYDDMRKRSSKWRSRSSTGTNALRR